MNFDISTIISIAVFALSVASSIISIIIARVKNKNKLENYKSEVDRSEQVISLISTIIPQAVEYAEKNGTGGSNKKLLALSKILVDCMNNGVDYTGASQTIDDTIEKLIEFSKEVNVVTAKKEV